jgi:transposase
MKEGKGDVDRCESLSTEYDFPGVRPRVDPHPTRYDKLADNYLAFIKLASIRLWIRAYESTP